MTNAAQNPDHARPKISIRNLAKRFGARQILRDVTIDVPAGHSLVVIGGSGVGKSVLLKSILGIVTPDAGSIAIDGTDILTANTHTRQRLTQQIGMLFQGAALFDSLTVWENIAFRLIYGEGQSRAAARARAEECLTLVGLEASVADQVPSELSGGMQKRAGLARAIAGKPDILFFDEPTTGLDPIKSDVINTLISSQVKALGATAISITHDMASAMKIADEIAMLHNGSLIWSGTPSEISNSGNPYVDQFINGRAEGPIGD
ncbi:MAG: ATP-binding cassette domain-containing protein [Pseudomonadota bacterium]